MKTKTTFYCTQCGNEYPRWMGKCPACGSWDTLVEQIEKTSSVRKNDSRMSPRKTAVLFGDVTKSTENRFLTGLGELDRVLGGGAVKGSLVLVGGTPGIGKSTLLMQMCSHFITDKSILYVTGEESEQQLKLRAERLGVDLSGMYLLAETNMDSVMRDCERIKPDVLVIDSIQTLYDEEMSSTPGSIGQVKECTMQLMRFAKSSGTTVFIIGHVNKEGAIAGPRVLEHMVDCVLYFEGSRNSNHRIIRASKNRFGSTNELGIFEMHETGLIEVKNPSEIMLTGRPENVPGTCVTCVIEGTRPILAEIQALLCTSGYSVPRRNSNGIDINRTMMILAVLEKRCGLKISGCDSYINVVGGLYLDEPAADLAASLAIASSYRDKPIENTLAAVGEVGLTGEVRMVRNLEQRLGEIYKIGFSKCIVPRQNGKIKTVPKGLEIIEVASIREAIAYLFRT
jgi:DNA repair protein RadA/Sms